MQQEAIDCLLHDTQSVHVDSVDDMLEKYKGNEEELFRKLEAKYGEEPVETKEEEPDPIEALDKELEEEKKKIAAIKTELAAANVSESLSTRSLTVATSPRKDSATSPTVASVYQIKSIDELPQKRFVQSTIKTDDVSIYEGYGDDYTVA